MNSILLGLTLLTTGAYSRQLRPEKRLELSRRSLSEKQSYKYCDSPITRGKVEFPDSIIGRAKHDFDMYSGYINITESPDYLFYWLFETQDKNPNAPLVIWTNGGPGCTAMEGATTEHGPLVLFDMKESCTGPQCDYTKQFSTNPYAWNKHANVLYLDQPKNVGYSFGYGDGTKTSVESGDDFVIFYREWLKAFPEYDKRQLIIGGESYGGHYIPAWSNSILNYNEQNTLDPINLSGVIIGNGCVNNTVQDVDTFIEFQHRENLIPVDSNPKNQGAAEIAMVNHLGYTPNYYDYRIESITCDGCYSYNYTAWSYWFLQPEVLEALNVCGEAGEDAFSGAAGGCISMGAFDAHDDFDYSGALARTLNANIPVSVFYGKSDTACQYVGGYAMTNTIAWDSQSEWAETELSAIELAGSNVGSYKSVNGLSYYEVSFL